LMNDVDVEIGKKIYNVRAMNMDLSLEDAWFLQILFIKFIKIHKKFIKKLILKTIFNIKKYVYRI
jgi:hypothetical protein